MTLSKKRESVEQKPEIGDPCAECGEPWSLDPFDIHSQLVYGKGAHRFVPQPIHCTGKEQVEAETRGTKTCAIGAKPKRSVF